MNKSKINIKFLNNLSCRKLIIIALLSLIFSLFANFILLPKNVEYSKPTSLSVIDLNKNIKISGYNYDGQAYTPDSKDPQIVIPNVNQPDILVGYSSIMAALLFIGGVIMLLLGMIGEYLGRIYISINKSPQYVVRKTVNIKEKDNEK